MPVQFDSVASESTVIAVVLVESARLIRDSAGEVCGTEYLGKVEVAVKGAVAKANLRFGNVSGRVVGNSYLVFLSMPGARYDFTFLPFYGIKPTTAEVEFRKRCEPVLPALRESYEGLSTLEVESQDVGKPSTVLLHPPVKHVIPSGLPFTPTAEAAQFAGVLVGPVRVQLEHFLEKVRASQTGAK